MLGRAIGDEGEEGRGMNKGQALVRGLSPPDSDTLFCGPASML